MIRKTSILARATEKAMEIYKITTKIETLELVLKIVPWLECIWFSLTSILMT